MRTPVRAAIAIALVGTVFLMKIHLDSISQWRNDAIDLTNGMRDLYLDGDAHIELVSASTAAPTARSSTRKWTPLTRPTPRPVAPEHEPKRVPVYVPGAGWDRDPFWRVRKPQTEFQKIHADLLSPAAREVEPQEAPSSTAPPRPKITPKSDRIIILGKMSYENTDWLEEQLPE